MGKDFYKGAGFLPTKHFFFLLKNLRLIANTWLRVNSGIFWKSDFHNNIWSLMAVCANTAILRNCQYIQLNPAIYFKQVNYQRNKAVYISVLLPVWCAIKSIACKCLLPHVINVWVHQVAMARHKASDHWQQTIIK